MCEESWGETTVEGHADIRARIGWKGLSTAEYVDQGPYLIAGKHILNGEVRWEQCDHVSWHRYRESPEIALRVGDVIISKDGTIGRVARIDHLPGEATINGTMMLVRPRDGLDYRFLYHLLNGRNFQDLVGKRMSGSSIPHLFQRDVRHLPIDLPPLRKQRWVADIIDILDKQIDAENKILEKLALVRDAVLFRELQQIEGCRSVRLEEIAAVERGRFVARPRNDSRFYGGACPFIQTGDVARGSGKVIYDATQSLNGDGRRVSREFPAGTIAVTIAANIGETSILGRPMCFPDSVVGVVVSPGVSTRFIELCIRQLKPILESRAPQSAQKNINLQDLRLLEIPLPSGDVQMSIERLWTKAERLISEASQGVHKLRLVKQGLMEDLLTGKVRVTRSGELTG